MVDAAALNATLRQLDGGVTSEAEMVELHSTDAANGGLLALFAEAMGGAETQQEQLATEAIARRGVPGEGSGTALARCAAERDQMAGHVQHLAATPEVRGSVRGASFKTGFELARARLQADDSGGVPAARARRVALLGKGTFRNSETLALQAPTGTLSMRSMPKRRLAVSDEEHREEMARWKRANLQRGKVTCAY